MAKQKIDTSLIEGYAAMSAEDKLKALEALEFDVPDDLSAQLKAAMEQRDKYSSEIAERKKKERESIDEASKKAADYEEKLSDLQGKYDALLKESTIANLTATYKGLGYSDELAKEKAKAMAAGDTKGVLSCEEKYRKDIEKALRAELTKETPPPGDRGSAGKTYKSKEEIMQIRDTVERQKAIRENPSLFELPE